MEHGELPGVRHLIVLQNVNGVVVALYLEIGVIRSEPTIEDLRHLDAALAEEKPPRCLFTPVPGVALDTMRKGLQSLLKI